MADLPDLDLRLLRTFVAVAEELHFGRAGDRLHLAQPAVSGHIRRLEDEVGVPLLHRTSRRVELTPAGATFLEHARRLQDSVRAAIDEARRIDRGQSGSLAVGVAPGALVEPLRAALEAFAEARPDVAVELRESAFTDPSGGLGDGAADVAIIRPPISTPGVAIEVLFEEPRVAVVPARHALAERAELEIADLLDEPWTFAETDPVWRAFWTAEAERGAPARYGPLVQSMEGIAQAVGLGLAVGLVPASAARALQGDDLACRPVRGVAPTTVAVAWRRENEDPRVRAFVAIARRACGVPER